MKLFIKWFMANSSRLTVDSQSSTVNRQRSTVNQKGISLIEAVLTITIIGVALIGVMYIFSGSTVSSLKANQTIIASNLAKEKMEQIIADRQNNGYAATIATNYSDGALSGDYSEFTRTVTILEVNPDADGGDDDFLDASPGSGYARVTVVVSFGASDSVKLETLIANYTIP